MSFRHLSADQIRQIHAVAIAILDEEDQDALLSSLPTQLLAALPARTLKPSPRLLQTLNELNGIPSLADGSVPLSEWLRNLRSLYGFRPEIKKLEALAAHVEGCLEPSVPVATPRASNAAMYSPFGHRVRAAPPPPSRWPCSPLIVELHRSSGFASGRLFEKRLFQTLTGESAPAFRDLHVPFRRLVLPATDPLAGRRHEVRRLTLVLAGPGMGLGPDALSIVRARATAPGDMERVATAWLGPSPSELPDTPGVLRLPVDIDDDDLCATSLDVTLLDLLCGWLSGPGDRTACRTLAISAMDAHGHIIANEILEWMGSHGLDATLLDNRATGLDESASMAAVVVLRTDGWGQAPRGELGVLHAKELGIPVVVVEALAKGEERSFPYLGNTPTVRWVETPAIGSPMGNENEMSRSATQMSIARQSAMIARAALQEALRVRLARFRVEGFDDQSVGMQALPRPPELLDATHTTADFILYPDPPVGEHEIALLRRIRPGLCVLTPTQWQSYRSRPLSLSTSTGRPQERGT